MSQEVRKWLVNGLQLTEMGYIGAITHLLSIDPNFLGHPSFKASSIPSHLSEVEH